MGKIKHFKHSYEELAKVGRKYYNDTNFCTVIGLAVACDLSFGKARALAKRKVGRRDRRGLNLLEIIALYKMMGKNLVPVPNVYGKTLATVSRNVPINGRYMFLTRTHCAVSRDGILEDWSADGDSRKRIDTVYKIEDI